jgi:SAM-dependent methyltransferase
MVSDAQRWNGNIHYHPVIFEAIPPGCQRALDVGCGDGLLTRQLHRQGIPQVTGIDLHEPSIEAARTHADANGIAYIVDDVLTHPFELASFDLVTAVASLHHIDTTAALTRLRDLVGPGGVLAVVGLARSDLPADIPRDLAGMIVSRIYKRTKPFQEQTAPIVWPPPDRYATTRQIATQLLPGVRWRRHLLFRYSLVWTKPPHRTLDRPPT